MFSIWSGALKVVHFGQGVEFRPVHATADRVVAERRDDAVRLVIESIEQRGAAQHGAGGFAELVAGQSGAVDLLVSCLRIDALNLYRGAAGGKDECEQEGQEIRPNQEQIDGVNRSATYLGDASRDLGRRPAANMPANARKPASRQRHWVIATFRCKSIRVLLARAWPRCRLQPAGLNSGARNNPSGAGAAQQTGLQVRVRWITQPDGKERAGEVVALDRALYHPAFRDLKAGAGLKVKTISWPTFTSDIQPLSIAMR